MSTSVDLNKENLALTSTLLSVLQASWKAYELLTHIVGTTFVISGCEDDGNSVANGYVSVNNEIMAFDTSNGRQTYVHIEEDTQTITVDDGSYTRTTKKLVFGIGENQFPYSNLVRPDNILSIIAKLNNKASTTALADLAEIVADKVDKVTGKTLTSNDFTTELLNKLNGIADNANNYTHPSSHTIDIIPELQTQLDTINAALASKEDKSVLHEFTTQEANAAYQLPNTANNYVHFGAINGSVIDVKLPIVGGIIKDGSIVRIAWPTAGFDSEYMQVYPSEGYNLIGNARYLQFRQRESATFQLSGTTWYPISGYLLDLIS